jgi:very-short-patch-repair endonuclease
MAPALHRHWLAVPRDDRAVAGGGAGRSLGPSCCVFRSENEGVRSQPVTLEPRRAQQEDKLLRFQKGQRRTLPPERGLVAGCPPWCVKRGETTWATSSIKVVETIARCIRRHHWFLRRRDLLARGFTDQHIRDALDARHIFRVRQGWYSVPDAPADAIRAVRVGGRLTGLSALKSFGLRVPARDTLYVAVPVGACRLRDPEDRRARSSGGSVVVSWSDEPRDRHLPGVRTGRGATSWRVGFADALLAILASEPRDIAVACASAAAHKKRISERQLDEVFARAPSRARCWRHLVSRLDESHGETFARLWLRDAGFAFESQPQVRGVGRLDGRVSPNVYVEVDGGQHDPAWTGEGDSSYESDRSRDLAILAMGGRTVRLTYRLLYGHWDDCLAAIGRAVSDDAELSARRSRHPPPRRAFDSYRVSRKRRRNGADGLVSGTSPPR